MHSDHDLEKEVRASLRDVQLQKPPQELLSTFEDQVWSRITNPRPALPVLFLAAPVMVLFVLLAGYGLWLLKQPALPLPETAQTTVIVSMPTAVSIPETAQTSVAALTHEMHPSAENEPSIPDDILDSRIRDLLVLEWLGEADGLLEDFNQMPVETAVARTI